ncbi:hypothetical protein EAG_02087 [Camponotus floridanus]|uniref:Uncharacterized protein n=1 Tax=Camponotus floridanus TaxID=104421 RepID=E2B1L9_CAMFO|nr:hypothetical protein EAG_02087 [Camponotus floridanus]
MMTNSRSDTRNVDGERVRFRRASAKPECHPEPKAEQRRESKRKRERERWGKRKRERDRVPIESTSEHSMFVRTFDSDLTAYGSECFSMDVREGSLAREMRLREGKGKGRERAEVRDFESGPTEPAMRLVIHYGHPGAR